MCLRAGNTHGSEGLTRLPALALEPFLLISALDGGTVEHASTRKTDKFNRVSTTKVCE